MSDLRWAAVREWFDPMKNGSAPDLVIAGTTLADWEALLELIRGDGWRGEYEHHDRRAEMPASAEDFFAADQTGQHRSLWVWPDREITIVFRPWDVAEIFGDVDLFELQGRSVWTPSARSCVGSVGH